MQISAVETMYPNCRRLKGGIVSLGLIVLALWPAASGWAQPRDKCTEEYARAESTYLEGNFDEAIRLLQTCLDREDLFEDEAVRVYRLMALVHVNRGDFDQAQLALVNLLGRSPGYEPDPVEDPPAYSALVRLVKEQLAAQQPLQPPLQEPPPEAEEAPAQAQRSWFSGPRRWLILVGGAAAAGTVAALVLSDGQQETGPQPLPLPPALP